MDTVFALELLDEDDYWIVCYSGYTDDTYETQDYPFLFYLYQQQSSKLFKDELFVCKLFWDRVIAYVDEVWIFDSKRQNFVTQFETIVQLLFHKHIPAIFITNTFETLLAKRHEVAFFLQKSDWRWGSCLRGLSTHLYIIFGFDWYKSSR